LEDGSIYAVKVYKKNKKLRLDYFSSEVLKACYPRPIYRETLCIKGQEKIPYNLEISCIQTIVHWKGRMFLGSFQGNFKRSSTVGF
jgi:hypothetical protein